MDHQYLSAKTSARARYRAPYQAAGRVFITTFDGAGAVLLHTDKSVIALVDVNA